MKQYQLDLEKYKSLARQAAAEGCVLLLNENKTLPFQKGETVSIFGRSQMNYYKSGTGSGGMVNVDYSIGITEGLINSEEVLVNKELLEIYSEWVKKHPFDIGMGWAQEPWFQEEMPLSDNLLQDASKKSDTAIVILGRTAGEDRDNTATEGSYYLTAQEKSMLEQVRRNFTKMVVVLNVGNIIDMGWMDEYKPDAVIYVWQGGQEGGNGVADVLTGKINPCGKLTDTIAYNLTDYPSYHNYGDEKVNFYEEDIYVGYRYFETVAKDKVKYPFGYGLSYTSFELDVKKQSELTYSVTVTNIGDIPGKEVVQIYVQAPQGLLGKPSRVLVDFGKTGMLKPKESETLCFTIDHNRFASYDDSGCTGYKSCYVLEAGEYSIYIGSDVKSAILADCYTLQNLIVTEKLSEAMAPVEHFDRMKIKKHNEGEFSLEKEKVPTRTSALSDRIMNNRPSSYPYTGDQGYKLADVLNNKTSMENFIAQLSNEDLACIIRGEGMCSPKVTPGTAGAYGGVTEELKNYGIPIGCCADGPSGIRMDCGTKAFSLPNGTLLACTFNRKLNEDLFEMLGIELGKHRIEALLGPGINIHRNPLNGRNFEYFSEDPYLTGQIAAAQLKGLHKQGTTGVIKHFCGNNQEFHRMDCNSVISERALREIYLKGFEIAVKEGGAHYVMTSYNPVNGIWCAGSYDLNTTILREEWGFHGIVMTDWWAQINEEGESQSRQNTAYMVRAQNDLYMVVSDSKINSHQDNTMEMLEKGVITRGDLQRSAANICHALMFSNAMDRFMYPENYINSDVNGSQGDTLFAENIKYYDIDNGSVINLSSVDTTKGSTAVFGVHILRKGEYKVYITVSSEASEIAQMPFTLFLGGHPVATLTVVGTSGKEIVMERNIMMFGENSYLKFYFGQSGIVLSDIKFEFVKEFNPF